MPKPLQKPHPPTAIAANSPETAEFAGLNGYDVMVAAPINPMPGFFDHVSRYRQALDARRPWNGEARPRRALLYLHRRERRQGARRIRTLDDALLPHHR